jgi:hypothetical protein
MTTPRAPFTLINRGCEASRLAPGAPAAHPIEEVEQPILGGREQMLQLRYVRLGDFATPSVPPARAP